VEQADCAVYYFGNGISCSPVYVWFPAANQHWLAGGSRLAGEIGLVYDFRPVISASLPTLLVFALAAWQFHRTR